jgi:isopentenyl-diphosphate delta-isomerase
MLKYNHVVLVDESDNIIGIKDKFIVHNSDTPLHRGVSVFLFNNKKEFLIQKRSLIKKTWPSFWSNSFCGHPRFSETYEDAAHRHGKLELGITLEKLHFISHYRYKFSFNNIVENEICPIYLAISNDEIIMNKNDIEAIKLLSWSEFLMYLEKYLPYFTPWCTEEVNILRKSDIFTNFMDSIL